MYTLHVASTPGRIFAFTSDLAKIRPGIDCILENMPPSLIIRAPLAFQLIKLLQTCLNFQRQSSRNCNIREKFICQTSGRVSKDGLVFREMNRLCLRSYCAVPRCFCEQFEALKTSTVGTRVVYEVNKRRVESLKW